MTLKTKDIVDKFADLPGEQRQGLATATGSDPGGDRGGRGGYAGEFDAISPPGRVSELGDVAGNAGYKLVPFGASCPANGYYPDS